MIIRRCVPEIEQGRILYECHASPYRGHFQETKQPIKFSNQVFISLPFSKIVLSGLNFVINAREWEISAEDMKCPCKVSWWCSFFMCGE